MKGQPKHRPRPPFNTGFTAFKAPGLVSFWSGDNGEVAGDQAQDNRSGLSLTDTGGVTRPVGVVGNALGFVPGQDLEAADDPRLRSGAGDFYISLWLKRSVFFAAGTNGIFVKGSGTTAGVLEYGLFAQGTGVKFSVSDGASVVNTPTNATLINAPNFVFAWLDSVGRNLYLSLNSSGSFVTVSVACAVLPQQAAFSLGVGAFIGGTTFVDAAGGWLDQVALGTGVALGNGSPGTLAALLAMALYNGGAGVTY